MKKGQVLVAVLLIFVILSLVMAGILNILEGNIKKVEAQKGEKQALYLAEGGAEIAIHSLIWFDLSSGTYTFSGVITQTDFSGRYTTTLFWNNPNFEILSIGTVDLWTRILDIEGVRSGVYPYSLTITLWSEE
ncbi:MAG: hypothetical protein NZ841_05290 [Dictyoglomus sp.]|nr:hypothetical protein [Dictyoglomus sp.]MDW8188693.1 hypothetical protein [Dictyoglomus sp.]